MLEGFFFAIYLIRPRRENFRQKGDEIKLCESETGTKGEDIDGIPGSIWLTKEL
jgi:hypothetical protein